MLVLPTAAAFEHPDRLIAQAAEWFAPVGGTVVNCPVLNRRDAVNPALVAMIRDARFIYIAGDSTSTDQAREPFNSWGQMLPRFFTPGIAVGY